LTAALGHETFHTNRASAEGREAAVSSGQTSAPRPAGLSAAGFAAAVGVLTAFAAFVVFMLTEVGTEELRWSRLAWVFSSVEAIAFGAAGALFGSSIQRARAENAEAEARRNADEAANGRALASAVLSDEPSGDAATDLETLGPAEQRGSAVARSHAALARDLFPHVAGRRT
jgi:hypothetical protein